MGRGAAAIAAGCRQFSRQHCTPNPPHSRSRPAPPADPNHGSGRSGTSTPAGTMTVVSVVRGDWEVRVVHVQNLADTARAVQAGGWVLSDDAGITVATGPQRVDTASRTLSACVAGLHGWDEAAV